MANISDLLQMLKQKEKPHKKSRFDDLENCKSLIIGEYKNGKSINQIVDELRLKCGLKTTRKRVSEFLKQLGYEVKNPVLEKRKLLLENAELVKNLYEETKSLSKTVEELEKRLGVRFSRESIRNLLKELGIETRKREKFEHLKPFADFILQAYNDGYSISQIVRFLREELNVKTTIHTVSAFIKEMLKSTNNTNEQKLGKSTNHKQ